MTSLPVIDFSLMSSSALGDRLAVAGEIRQACLKNGFFYLRNAGVSPEAMRDILDAAKMFFALPVADRQAISKEQSPAGRGYEIMSGQRLEATAQPDLKEGFVMGTDLPETDPRVMAGWPQHGSNQWPRGMDEWKKRVEAYHAAMTSLARRIMSALALSLDMPETYFDAAFQDSIATLRLLHYPPQPADAGVDARGAGAHTDWGAITILLQDDAGGLQISDDAGGWIDALPIKDSFVINLGDLVPRWTNGLYRSTRHRVINRSGRERYAIPFFFDGRGDYISDCVPTCLKPGEKPLYPPLSVNDHLAEMFRSTREAAAFTDGDSGYAP